MRPYPIYLIIITGIIFFQCGSKIVPLQSSCVHHDLYIKVLPQEQTLLAKDTLQLQYSEMTNEFYFFLNRALTIRQIKVGDQDLDFEVISDFDQRAQLHDSVLYKVNFPKSLFPTNIQIWYEGSFSASQGVDIDEKTCEIDQNTVALTGDLCWYPRTLEDKSTFSVKAYIPDNMNLASNADFVYSEQSNDSLLCLWEQTEPMEQLDIYSLN